MQISDLLFISKQLILIGRMKYDSVLENCNKLKEKKGECYAYHYTLLYLGYYKKEYDMSYISFYWLIKNNKIKRKLIDWGLTLFVEKIIIFEKRYEIAKKRIIDLLILGNLKDVQIQKLKSILKYLDEKDR